MPCLGWDYKIRFCLRHTAWVEGNLCSVFGELHVDFNLSHEVRYGTFHLPCHLGCSKDFKSEPLQLQIFGLRCSRFDNLLSAGNCSLARCPPTLPLMDPRLFSSLASAFSAQRAQDGCPPSDISASGSAPIFSFCTMMAVTVTSVLPAFAFHSAGSVPQGAKLQIHSFPPLGGPQFITTLSSATYSIL